MKAYKYDWVWKKPQGVDPLLSKIRPLNNIENIIVFSSGRTLYNPQFQKGVPYNITRDKVPRSCEINNHVFTETTTKNNGFRYPTRVLEFKNARGLHPTQKPVELLEYLIKTYTNEGDTVLDFTMGSGSTGVACKNLNRKFIGIELDKKYFEVAVARINGEM